MFPASKHVVSKTLATAAEGHMSGVVVAAYDPPVTPMHACMARRDHMIQHVLAHDLYRSDVIREPQITYEITDAHSKLANRDL
jgi:hypothetical protein